MPEGRDIDSKNTLYSIVSLEKDPSLELILLRKRRGHEIIRAYYDLSAFFSGKLKLAYPKKIAKDEQIREVQYFVPANREDIEQVDKYSFQQFVKDEVYAEYKKINEQVERLDDSADNKQKRQLLKDFLLPSDFEQEGHKHLVRVKSDYVLLHWGFFKFPEKIDMPLPEDLPESKKIKKIEIHEEIDSLVFRGILDGDPSEFRYEWKINGKVIDRERGSILRLYKSELKDYPETLEVLLRIWHIDRINDSDSKTEDCWNPFFVVEEKLPSESSDQKDDSSSDNDDVEVPDELTATIRSGSDRFSFFAHLNKESDDPDSLDYEWRLNDKKLAENAKAIKLNDDDIKGQPEDSKLCLTVRGIFDGREEQVEAYKSVNITNSDKLKAWWSSPDNRKKVWIALILLILLLILLFWLRSASTGDSASTQDGRGPSNDYGPTVPINEGRPQDPISGSQNGGSPSSLPPSESFGDPNPDEPINPYPPKGNLEESDLTPNQIKQFEESGGDFPKKIGDIYCNESGGKIKVWMQMLNGQIFIMDTFGSDQGNCEELIRSMN